MARADRLMDLVELLRGRDATTIDALADELGVTPRTLYRDLALLRDRGLPISAPAWRSCSRACRARRSASCARCAAA